MMVKFKHFLSVFLVLLMPLWSSGLSTGWSSAHADETAAVKLLVFGDSLVAGYGLPQPEAFPLRLEEALRSKGHQVDVLNGGVSGDTSAGGARRIDWALADNPDAVLVVLGGNDALRGLPPEAMAANLDTILAALEARQLKIMLAGMHAPANMGQAYGTAFDAAFADVIARAQARGSDIRFYPFFLEGVALVPELNQDDGIHPNPAGVAVIVENILPHVEALITSVGKE